MAPPRVSGIQLARLEAGPEYEWYDKTGQPRWWKLPGEGRVPSELVIEPARLLEQLRAVVDDADEVKALWAKMQADVRRLLEIADPDQVEHLPDEFPGNVIADMLALVAGGNAGRTLEGVLRETFDSSADMDPIAEAGAAEGPPTKPKPAKRPRRSSGSRSATRSRVTSTT